MKKPFTKSVDIICYHIYCDRCGKMVVLDDSNIFQSILNYRTGANHQDGTGNHIIDEIEIDLCEDCAKIIFKQIVKECNNHLK